MEVKIGGITVDVFESMTLTRRFDSLVSDFSLTVKYVPGSTVSSNLLFPQTLFPIGNFPLIPLPVNVDRGNVIAPFRYKEVVFTENGKTIFTGVVLNATYTEMATTELVSISGYCKTGILEDSNIDISEPVQFDNLTLREIASQLIRPFGIGMVVDPVVKSFVDMKYSTTAKVIGVTIKEYLSNMARQRFVVMTHDVNGNLVFTRVRAGTFSVTSDQLANAPIPEPFAQEIEGSPVSVQTLPVTVQKDYKPIYNFDGGQPEIVMRLSCNGQGMHGTIISVKQVDSATGKPKKMQNPYGRSESISVTEQTYGDATMIQYVARNALAAELKNIVLTIEMKGWYLNGIFVEPNNLVTVISSRLFINKKTLFFIESVSYSKDATGERCTLTCVLPEVYTLDTPQNIFL